METGAFLRRLRERDLFYAFLRMPAIDQVPAIVVQPELMSGESILWAGQPRGSVIFHKEDSFLIPFSLFWGGFAIFWEASVLRLSWNHSNGPASLFILWGIPFVVVGQYLIWGRFVYAGWLKRRTYYAVTNRRVLVIQNGWKRQIAAAYIDSLPSLIKEGGSNGIGILRFGPSQSMWLNNRGWRGWNALSVADQPVFVDIDDVDGVYRLVSDLRERSRSTKSMS
jgi:hypothetical protein